MHYVSGQQWKVYDRRMNGERMQRAVTVMGRNTLHHLGKGVEDEDEEDEEDEEDKEHSDKGEPPHFSVGDIVAVVEATSTPQQPQTFCIWRLAGEKLCSLVWSQLPKMQQHFALTLGAAHGKNCTRR